jgi:hypothetical protein
MEFGKTGNRESSRATYAVMVSLVPRIVSSSLSENRNQELKREAQDLRGYPS